jgi:transposase
MTIVEDARAITGGVDTHAGTHVAAALDPVGGLLGAGESPVTPAGYARLLAWLGGFGTVGLAGIEGTGSYGAGLARHVTAAGIRVVEAGRPDRQDRRRQGKPRPAGCLQRRPGRPVGPGPRRTQRPRRRGRGYPGLDGRQAQRPLLATRPSTRPGP